MGRKRQGGYKGYYTMRKVPLVPGYANKLLAGQVKRNVKRLIDKSKEPKYIASSATYQYVDSTGAIIDLTSIAQGDTDTTRDGDQCKLQRVTFNFQVFLNNAVITQAMVRVILFRWKNFDNAVAPLPGDVLLMGLGSINAPLSTYVHDTRENIEIIKDKTINVTTWSNGSSTMNFYCRLSKKLNSLVRFVGATTSGEGKIFALLVADTAAGAAANRPQISYMTQMDFIDN